MGLDAGVCAVSERRRASDVTYAVPLPLSTGWQRAPSARLSSRERARSERERVSISG